jgi:putative transposase
MSNQNEKKLLNQKHTVSMLTDHLVFCPKYRGSVLVGEVRDYAEAVIRGICRDMGVVIIRMAVNAEHVHMFYKYPPEYSVSQVAQRIKGVSSKRLRDRFPHLKSWCGGHLWAPSCFHGAVGNGWDVVDNYISNQQDYHSGGRICTGGQRDSGGSWRNNATDRRKGLP